MTDRPHACLQALRSVVLRSAPEGTATVALLPAARHSGRRVRSKPWASATVALRPSRELLSARSPPAAAGRLDPKSLPYGEPPDRFRWQLFAIEQVAAPGARLSTLGSRRGVPATLRNDRVAQRCGRLEFSHDAIPATVASCT